VLIDLDRRDCPCCGGLLHPIDEVRTEQLDIMPALLRVRVTRRPRYACRTCESAVVVAPAPERPIAGGMATEALITHVVVSKYCDSLPLYRQSQMLARQGVMIDRSTLSNWVGRVCWWLTPLYELIVSTVLSSPKLFADDTGHFWVPAWPSLPVMNKAIDPQLRLAEPHFPALMHRPTRAALMRQSTGNSDALNPS
jgi:transposase